MASVQLRAYSMVDRMQPQFAAYMGTILTGPNPIAGNAELYLEVAPAGEIYTLADVALKAADVRPGAMVVERQFGILELHAANMDTVQEAGEAILRHLGVTQADGLKPTILSTEIVTNVDPYQAQLINQTRRGSMIVPGESMLVVELTPGGYATLAMNEAEKASNITLIAAIMLGPSGQIMVSGSIDQVQMARDAAIRAIERVPGRSS